MQTLTAAQSIDIAQLSRDLFSQVISVNATYLATSVSIILGSGILISILLYFFNFKPMKEGLDSQTKDIEYIKKEIESNIKTLEKSQDSIVVSLGKFKTESLDTLNLFKKDSNRELENLQSFILERQKTFDAQVKADLDARFSIVNDKISKIEEGAVKKISNVEESYKRLDIGSTWDMQYVWENQKVYVNVFSSLITTLEKAIQYSDSKSPHFSDFYTPLVLKNLPKVIDQVIQNHPKIFNSLPKNIEKLESILSVIKGNDIEKSEVSSKLDLLKKALL